jgi:hypothetical protein
MLRYINADPIAPKHFSSDCSGARAHEGVEDHHCIRGLDAALSEFHRKWGRVRVFDILIESPNIAYCASGFWVCRVFAFCEPKFLVADQVDTFGCRQEITRIEIDPASPLPGDGLPKREALYDLARVLEESILYTPLMVVEDCTFRLE